MSAKGLHDSTVNTLAVRSGKSQTVIVAPCELVASTGRKGGASPFPKRPAGHTAADGFLFGPDSVAPGEGVS